MWRPVQTASCVSRYCIDVMSSANCISCQSQLYRCNVECKLYLGSVVTVSIQFPVQTAIFCQSPLHRCHFQTVCRASRNCNFQCKLQLAQLHINYMRNCIDVLSIANWISCQSPIYIANCISCQSQLYRFNFTCKLHFVSDAIALVRNVSRVIASLHFPLLTEFRVSRHCIDAMSIADCILCQSQLYRCNFQCKLYIVSVAIVHCKLYVV